MLTLLNKCNILDIDAESFRLLRKHQATFSRNEQLVGLLNQCAEKSFESKDQDIDTNIDFQGAVVDWDSKLLLHILKNKNAERLAILISCGDEELGVSQIENNPAFTLAITVSFEVKKCGLVKC